MELREVLELTKRGKVLVNDVTIYPFKFKHLHHLIELLHSNNYQGISDISMRTLPKVGFIVFSGKAPLAAGFLRRLEPCYAQIDTLTSNKFLGSMLRNQGITMIVDELISEAKRLKLEGLICHTSHQDVLKRAESLGFHTVEQKIIALPLIKI